jgi:two-component system, NtrC family, sensor kinase
MKAVFRFLASLCAAALLLAVLGVLYVKTQELKPQSRDTVNGLLRDLEQIDAEVNTDVLRSKTGINKHYDFLARAQQLIGQAQESLAAQKLETLDFSLKGAEKQLTDAIAVKLDLVDRFKAQNAILKNSLRFIAVAAEDLKQKLRDARDPAGRPVHVAGLPEGIDQVLVETLRLEAAGDGGGVAKVRELLSSLVANRGAYPPAVGESFDIFANHIITILAQKEREEELLKEMASVPVTQRIEALGEAFGASFEQANEKHDQYRIAMQGYGAFLIALLAFVFGRRGRKSAPIAA